MVNLKKVYISGPIATRPFNAEVDAERREAFHTMEDYIRLNHHDWEPVNPLKVPGCPDMSCGGDDNFGHTWSCWLKNDIKAMLECDAILMMPGYLQSRGANLEHHIAAQVGLHVMYYDNEKGILQ